MSILFTAVFAASLTFVILSALRMLFGDLRVDEEGQHEGLDLAEHSESAYTMGGQSAA